MKAQKNYKKIILLHVGGYRTAIIIILHMCMGDIILAWGMSIQAIYNLYGHN